MRRVNVSSVLTAVLAALLVGFWSWVLITPNSVRDCPSRPTAGVDCLTPTPVRVDTVLPLVRYVQGLRSPIGPNYGVTVSGLPGGVRTVYLDGSGMAQLDPQPGQTLIAHVLSGKVEQLSGAHEIAWANGYSPGYRYGWIGCTLVVALLLALLARLDRRTVRNARVWRWAERAAVLAAFGSAVAVVFAEGRAEMLLLVVCTGLLLALETAGQHWGANPGLRNRPPVQGLWIDVRKPRR